MVQRHRGVRLTPTHDWDQQVTVVPTMYDEALQHRASINQATQGQHGTNTGVAVTTTTNVHWRTPAVRLQHQQRLYGVSSKNNNQQQLTTTDARMGSPSIEV